MSYAGERSLSLGLQMGKGMSEPIFEAMQAQKQRDEQEKLLGLRQTFEDQQQQKLFQQQQAMNQQGLKNTLTLASLEHPEYGLTAADTPDASGVFNPKKTDVTADQANDSGNVLGQLKLQQAIDNQRRQTGVPGIVQDPTLRSNELQRQFQLQMALTRMKALADQPVEIKQGANGNYYRIPQKIGAASPVMTGETQPLGAYAPPPTKDMLGPNNVTHTYAYNPQNGKYDVDQGVKEGIGVSESKDAQGNVIAVPNKMIPGQPVQSSPVTSNQGTPLQAFNPQNAPMEVAKQINQEPQVKFYKETHRRVADVQQAYDAAVKEGNARAADPVLNESMQRLMSDQSIRQSAYERAAHDQPVLDALKGWAEQKYVGGAGLSNDTRAKIVKMAQELDVIAKNAYQNTLDGYRASAQNGGRGEQFDNEVAPTFTDYKIPGATQSGGVPAGMKIQVNRRTGQTRLVPQ